MKAYVLHDVNKLTYEDIPMPECSEGWAIVKVKVAGICSSDIPRIFTKGTYHFPTIPGHEFSGIVYEVGTKEDTSLIGKKVGVFPLIPCRECNQCRQKRYEMCSHYDYVGSRRDGGFAEYVAVPVWNLIPLPDNISFVSAAMLEPLSVALHAIKLGNIKETDSVGIIGTGMIGISAGQWARRYGAKSVTVIGRNEEKRNIVERSNLHYVIASNEMEQYDLVLEAVGTPQSIALALSSAKPGGTVVFMGNPSGDICLTQDTYWKILRKQLIIKGTWNSSYDGVNQSDWTEAVDALSKAEIDVNPLVSHTFSQNGLFEGLNLMRNHLKPYCKVITLWNENE